MDNSHFSKWTPLTGVYIATATLVCAIAIIKDLVDGLRSRLYWIPSGYTSLNSVSLTILGAATKLSMDLSTTMPRHVDQLAKLGTSSFMCIALATIQPSLGKLKSSELLSNMVALSILVISSIVSLCIQLRSGVIYTFKTAHVIMLTMTGLLLLQCVLSCGIIPLLKQLCQTIYQEQSHLAQKKWIDVEDNNHLQTGKLKQYLKRFSIMAQFGCPQFLLSLSSEGTLPTIWGLVAAVVFFVTLITSITHGDKFLASESDSSNSAYNWSILWISISQSIALGVGTIVLCIRGCYIAMVYLKGMDSTILERNAAGIETSYVTFSIQLISAFIKYSHRKSLVYKLMHLLSVFPISFSGIVLLISTRISDTIDSCWKSIVSFCFSTTRRCVTFIRPHSPSPTTRPREATEEEVLSGQYSAMPGLEKEGSVKWIMKSFISVTQKDMSAKERKTENLEELLRQYLSPNFKGVVSFDSEEIAPLDSKVSLPNCWSLPVVTLTSIAIALPNIDRDAVVKLIKGVNEGLVFAKLIEDKFCDEPHLNVVRDAAYLKWIKDGGLRFSWHTVTPDFQNKSATEILESIATSAEKKFHKIANDGSVLKVAASSKYRLCKTILAEHRNENTELTQGDSDIELTQGDSDIELTQGDSEGIFVKLRVTIADILGACLTNLKQYILTECSNSSSIEKRREAASSILKFFGDTEKIMAIIDSREIPKMSREKMVFIDKWREYYQRQMQLP